LIEVTEDMIDSKDDDSKTKVKGKRNKKKKSSPRSKRHIQRRNKNRRKCKNKVPQRSFESLIMTQTDKYET